MHFLAEGGEDSPLRGCKRNGSRSAIARAAAHLANKVNFAHSGTSKRNRRVPHLRGEQAKSAGMPVNNFPNPAFGGAAEPRSEPRQDVQCSAYMTVLPNNMI